MTDFAAAELAFDADSFSIAKAGCPCPIEWCTAHVVRHAECGDAAGAFFGGVHVGRVRRFRNGRWATRIRRELAKCIGAEPSPEMEYAAQSMEDGQNLGLIPVPTAAQRRQERARRSAGMIAVEEE